MRIVQLVGSKTIIPDVCRTWMDEIACKCESWIAYERRIFTAPEGIDERRWSDHERVHVLATEPDILIVDWDTSIPDMKSVLDYLVDNGKPYMSKNDIWALCNVGSMDWFAKVNTGAWPVTGILAWSANEITEGLIIHHKWSQISTTGTRRMERQNERTGTKTANAGNAGA